jgi:hypothetical protein
MKYYDMIFDDIWQFGGVVMLTGCAILDRYNAVA